MVLIRAAGGETMRTAMWSLVCVLVWANGAWAQSHQTIKQLVEGIKHASQDSERTKLKEQLWEATPQTSEDIDALAAELEGPLSPLAQKVLARTTSRDLVPAIINACERKTVGLKNLNEADFAKMGPEERSREIGRRLGLMALINTFGNIKDPRAVGLLKKYLDIEGLQFVASTALSKMGDDAIFRELLERSKTQRDINLASAKERHLREIVAEIDDPKTSQREKGRLLGQIKGSKDPAVNGLLKELILTHPNSDVRAQAGAALTNSIWADPSVADEDFMVQWLSMPGRNVMEDVGRGWAIDAIRKAYKPKYAPMLIGILQNSLADSTRSDAARLLGEQKVVEAVPYLEQAMRHDRDGGVRGASWAALMKITGRTHLMTNPYDIQTRIRVFEKHPVERKPGEIYLEEQNNVR